MANIGKDSSKSQRVDAFLSKFTPKDRKYMDYFGLKSGVRMGDDYKLVLATFNGRVGFKKSVELTKAFLEGEHNIIFGGYDINVTFENISFFIEDLVEVDMDIIALSPITAILQNPSEVELMTTGEEIDLLKGPFIDEDGDDIQYWLDMEIQDGIRDYLIDNVEHRFGVMVEPIDIEVKNLGTDS